MTRALALAALALALACGPRPSSERPRAAPTASPPTDRARAIAPTLAPLVPPRPLPPTGPPPTTTIAVDFDPAADRWHLRWDLGAPAVALRFERVAAIDRAQTWQVGPDLAWSTDRDGVVLRAVDGQARARFTATVATDPRTPSRLPPLHVRFADGGRLIDLGAVAADGELCTDDRCGPILRPRRWELTAPARQLRVGARVGVERLTWDEARDRPRPSYAYAGAEVGAPGPAAIVLLDRGLPTWLATETERLIAAVLPALAARTGLALPAPPVVFVARAAGRSRRIAVRGRAVPGALVLEARGDWRRRRPAALALWRELVVHEALHLWNGQVARRADRRDEWLSEGASTFVAGAELRAAGLLDATRYGRRVVAAANRCAALLDGPLYGDGVDAAYYPCGELLVLAIDRALVGQGGALTLLAGVWGAAAAAERPYATAELWPALTAAGVGADDLAAWRAVVEVGLGADRLATVRGVLARAGVVTTIVRGRRPRLRFVRWTPPV